MAGSVLPGMSSLVARMRRSSSCALRYKSAGEPSLAANTSTRMVSPAFPSKRNTSVSRSLLMAPEIIAGRMIGWACWNESLGSFSVTAGEGSTLIAKGGETPLGPLATRATDAPAKPGGSSSSTSTSPSPVFCFGKSLGGLKDRGLPNCFALMPGVSEMTSVMSLMRRPFRVIFPLWPGLTPNGRDMRSTGDSLALAFLSGSWAEAASKARPSHAARIRRIVGLRPGCRGPVRPGRESRWGGHRVT